MDHHELLNYVQGAPAWQWAAVMIVLWTMTKVRWTPKACFPISRAICRGMPKGDKVVMLISALMPLLIDIALLPLCALLGLRMKKHNPKRLEQAKKSPVSWYLQDEIMGNIRDFRKEIDGLQEQLGKLGSTVAPDVETLYSRGDTIQNEQQKMSVRLATLEGNVHLLFEREQDWSTRLQETRTQIALIPTPDQWKEMKASIIELDGFTDKSSREIAENSSRVATVVQVLGSKSNAQYVAEQVKRVTDIEAKLEKMAQELDVTDGFTETLASDIRGLKMNLESLGINHTKRLDALGSREHSTLAQSVEELCDRLNKLDDDGGNAARGALTDRIDLRKEIKKVSNNVDGLYSRAATSITSVNILEKKLAELKACEDPDFSGVLEELTELTKRVQNVEARVETRSSRDQYRDLVAKHAVLEKTVLILDDEVSKRVTRSVFDKNMQSRKDEIVELQDRVAIATGDIGHLREVKGSKEQFDSIWTTIRGLESKVIELHSWQRGHSKKEMPNVSDTLRAIDEALVDHMRKPGHGGDILNEVCKLASRVDKHDEAFAECAGESQVGDLRDILNQKADASLRRINKLESWVRGHAQDAGPGARTDVTDLQAEVERLDEVLETVTKRANECAHQDYVDSLHNRVRVLEKHDAKHIEALDDCVTEDSLEELRTRMDALSNIVHDRHTPALDRHSKRLVDTRAIVDDSKMRISGICKRLDRTQEEHRKRFDVLEEQSKRFSRALCNTVSNSGVAEVLPAATASSVALLNDQVHALEEMHVDYNAHSRGIGTIS